MTQNEHDDAVAAFIRSKGVTRCPTVCAVQTQASVGEADRAVLRELAAKREATRKERKQRASLRFGVAA
ncbi:MAG: hypothetical protein JO001_04890 [Alphaproteobacteria bacterium]|nr:hypothetical protein [Alphaproteobacteria bacterium]